MPVTENYMASGAWSLSFKDNVPPSVLQAMDPSTGGFGLIVVTPNYTPLEVGPIDLPGLLAAARYAGVFRRVAGTTISGAGLITLLGDEDGKGPILETTVGGTLATLTLQDWVSALIPTTINGVNPYSYSGAVTYFGTFQYVTVRQALTTICQATSCEMNVTLQNGAITLLAGTIGSAAAFPTYGTPRAIVARRRRGANDPANQSLRGIYGEMTVAVDVESITSKTIVIAQADGGASTGSDTNGSWPYIGIDGASLVYSQVVTGTDINRGYESTAAATFQAASSSVQREIVLAADAYDVSGTVAMGDVIYVFDPQLGIVDYANSPVYMGEQLPALMQRVYGYTWPVTNGMGVFFLPPTGSSPTPLDLTPYIQFEDAPARIQVGALPRPIFNRALAGYANPTGDMPKAIVMDAWAATIPTYSNLSLGNGSVDAAYCRNGRTVTYRGAITFGSTTSVTGAIQVSLPVAAKSATWSIGSVIGEDSSASFARTFGAAEINPSIFATGINFASTGNASWTATVPFTWATGDILRWTITYEAAAS